MTLIKLVVNGLEYSPNDGVDSVNKLHNFTIDANQSIYKLPVLRNLKSTISYFYDAPPNPDYDTVTYNYRLCDISKFDSGCLVEQALPSELLPTPINFTKYKLFRRYIYLTQGSYGVINIDNQDNRLLNEELPQSQKAKYGEFEYAVFDFNGDRSEFDLDTLNPKIVVDINSEFEKTVPFRKINPLRCVFPGQYIFSGATPNNYDLSFLPRLPVSAVVEAIDISRSLEKSTTNEDPPDIKALSLEDDPDTLFKSDDLIRGCLNIGNRLVFYSDFHRKIFFSMAADFQVLMKDPNNPTQPFSIVPTHKIESIAEFNGNMLAFTTTGIDRWVFSGNVETVLERDSTFHFNVRLKYDGAHANADGTLYIYTDDLHVYRLSKDFKLEPVFNGILPNYAPLKNYLNRDNNLSMAYFDMMGYKFVSVGPWLYNIDANIWSTYSFDGYKNPSTGDVSRNYFVYANDVNKQTISAACDNIICINSTICRPLTYEEMANEDSFNDNEPSTILNKHQWGEVAFFTTRLYQDDNIFTINSIELYVQGGSLKRGAKVWAKILRGSELGDFDIGNEDDYGQVATYEPFDATILGEDQRAYVGRFVWLGINIQTDRFRVQIITKEKRGMVLAPPLVDILYAQKLGEGSSIPQKNTQ